MLTRTKLSEVLEEQGRRQDWLAQRTGVSPATVNRVVRGTRTATPEFRAKASEALGVPEHDLFPDPVPA